MRTPILCSVLVILLACSTIAETESLSDIFPNLDAGISPPSIGDDFDTSPEATSEAEMATGAADMSEEVKALVAEAVDDTGEKATLVLNIKDIDTGESITNAHIRLLLEGQDSIDTLRFVGDNGAMELQLSQGSWRITLKLDITSTVGKDYYSSLDIVLTGDENKTAFLQPVGSIMGEVFDSSNTLIPGATVKFDCSCDYGITGSTVTDQFGSFTADWLPVGSCKVSALNGGKAGSITIKIAQGQRSDVEITLEQSVAATGEDYLWILVIIVIISIIILIGFKRKPKNVVTEEKIEIKADKHMADILSALEGNEKKIVEFLMGEGGKSRQNKIGRELGFPKASLSRALGALESRDLVKTEKLGRLKRVELSDWFLNGKKA